MRKEMERVVAAYVSREERAADGAIKETEEEIVRCRRRVEEGREGLNRFLDAEAKAHESAKTSIPNALNPFMRRPEDYLENRSNLIHARVDREISCHPDRKTARDATAARYEIDSLNGKVSNLIQYKDSLPVLSEQLLSIHEKSIGEIREMDSDILQHYVNATDAVKTSSPLVASNVFVLSILNEREHATSQVVARKAGNTAVSAQKIAGETYRAVERLDVRVDRVWEAYKKVVRASGISPYDL